MNKSLRVAMIISAYHPIVGGAERQLASVAPLLKKENIEIHVLTRQYPGLAPFEIINDVPVHRLRAPNPKSLSSLMFTAHALAKLRQLQPDVIHTYGFLSPLTAARLAKKIWHIPIVTKVMRGGRLGDVIKLKHKRFGAHRLKILNHVDRFITISEEIDTELAEIHIPPERRAFIPNGVDTSKFQPLSLTEKAIFRKNLGLPDAPIAVFTGRIAQEKRVDLLIDIWPSVREMHPQAQLLILGTGDQEIELRKKAGEGVNFLGSVADVSSYLKAADLFVLPSMAEGLSNSLLEAMAAGLPVVATEVGGTVDVIEHGISGWLIPIGDEDTLRIAVMSLLKDDKLRLKLGQEARLRIGQNYALPVVAQRLRTVYEQILTRPTNK